MNYLEARQRQIGRQWDYTQMRDGRIWPIGYCAGWQESTLEEFKARWGEHYAQTFYDDQERRRAFKDRYHEGGHASAEEACECYKQYLLDHDLRLDMKMGGTQKQCEVCQAWTQGLAGVGVYRHFVLCDEHRNREEVSKLLTVGSSIES